MSASHGNAPDLQQIPDIGPRVQATRKGLPITGDLDLLLYPPVNQMDKGIEEEEVPLDKQEKAEDAVASADVGQLMGQHRFQLFLV